MSKTKRPPYKPGDKLRGLLSLRAGICLVPGTVVTCEWGDDSRKWVVTADMAGDDGATVRRSYSWVRDNGESDFVLRYS